MEIVIVENVTLILFFFHMQACLFESHAARVVVRSMHISATVYFYLSAVFDSVTWSL